MKQAYLPMTEKVYTDYHNHLTFQFSDIQICQAWNGLLQRSEFFIIKGIAVNTDDKNRENPYNNLGQSQ